MANQQKELARRIQELVVGLPEEVVYKLADAIGGTSETDWHRLRTTVPNVPAQPAVRRQVRKLIDFWWKEASEVAPGSVAMALRAAMQVEEYHRQHVQLELVWSGPDTQVIPLRRTDQALLQLIGEANESLHIVSFAVYKLGTISTALVQAAGRGVSIHIYLETPDASADKITYDTIKALGQEVAQRAIIYVWPLDQRQLSPDGKHGSLHAKVAVADSRVLLISSANLTEYAMKLNMEMGLLVRGGPLPGQVEEHLERLVEEGVFTAT